MLAGVLPKLRKMGGHYEVLWSNPLAPNMMFGRLMRLATSSPVLKLSYGKMKKSLIDLNGDGDTGLVTVEATGNAYLKHGDNTYNGAPQYYIVDGSNAPIALTRRRCLKGTNLLCWLECHPS